MKRIPQFLAAVLVIPFAILVVGCSDNSPTLSDNSGDLNLTAEYGGYTATDEPPAFGDDALAEMMREDQVADDPAVSSRDAEILDSMPGTKAYVLGIRWGMLMQDSSITQMTDWSGSLGITHGVIHVLRTIRFEEGQDRLVRPRPNRQTLEWVSQTMGSFDGILVSIIVPPAPPDSDWSNNQVSFLTTPYSRVFSLAELSELDEIDDVDELGNQVAFNATDLKLDTCGRGQMEGRWLLNPSHRNGNFYGKWMSDDGLLMGHLRGHFGARPDGNKVFFGKYIGAQGAFRGLIRGAWGFSPNDSTSGWFEGIWAGREGRPLGTLRGRWGSVPENDSTMIEPPGRGNNDHGRGHDRNPEDHPQFGTHGWTPGFFSGQWASMCAPLRDSTSNP